MCDLTSSPPEAGSAPARLLDYIRVDAPQPVVLAYGIGVDSTALLCGESISSYSAAGLARG